MNNHPPVVFYFQLSLRNTSGKDEVFFKEISGITMEMGTEEMTKIGNNNYKYRAPNSIKYSNLVLKKGLVSKNSEIVIWCINTFNANPKDSIKPKDIVVKLLDTDGIPLKSWVFMNAYPVKWTVSDVNPENNITIEILEFAYSSFQ
ncbi:MAG: phage tail protein [Aequorivita antarctica]